MDELLLDEALINYHSYRFGRRQRLLRGPMPDLSGRYIAFLGGEQTFGKFVEEPYTKLVQEETKLTALNIGVDGAGPGFFLNDPVLLEAACRAEVCVIEMTSAWNLSNRLYTVGRRYNRRLRAVSDMLRGLYPQVDFEQYDFVGKMLERLHALDSEKFEMIEKEMSAAWVARMKLLLESVETKKILFWFSERSPDERTKIDASKARLKYPDQVTRDMIDQVAGMADGLVECVLEPQGPKASADVRPKVSRNFASPRMHAMASEKLTKALREYI